MIIEGLAVKEPVETLILESLLDITFGYLEEAQPVIGLLGHSDRVV